jgi:hypothetical protein
LAVDFDAPGRLNMHAIRELGVPRDADSIYAARWPA